MVDALFNFTTMLFNTNPPKLWPINTIGWCHSYLGFMRSGIGYVQSLICDHEGRLLHVHCDTEKMHTASPKSNSSHFWGQHTSSWPHCVHLLLQASLVSFAVNWSQWNNTTSNSVLCLPPEGGHSWCTGQSLELAAMMIKIAYRLYINPRYGNTHTYHVP